MYFVRALSLILFNFTLASVGRATSLDAGGALGLRASTVDPVAVINDISNALVVLRPQTTWHPPWTTGPTMPPVPTFPILAIINNGTKVLFTTPIQQGDATYQVLGASYTLVGNLFNFLSLWTFNATGQSAAQLDPALTAFFSVVGKVAPGIPYPFGQGLGYDSTFRTLCDASA